MANPSRGARFSARKKAFHFTSKVLLVMLAFMLTTSLVPAFSLSAFAELTEPIEPVVAAQVDATTQEPSAIEELDVAAIEASALFAPVLPRVITVTPVTADGHCYSKEYDGSSFETTITYKDGVSNLPIIVSNLPAGCTLEAKLIGKPEYVEITEGSKYYENAVRVPLDSIKVYKDGKLLTQNDGIWAIGSDFVGNLKIVKPTPIVVPDPPKLPMVYISFDPRSDYIYTKVYDGKQFEEKITYPAENSTIKSNLPEGYTLEATLTADRKYSTPNTQAPYYYYGAVYAKDIKIYKDGVRADRDFKGSYSTGRGKLKIIPSITLTANDVTKVYDGKAYAEIKKYPSSNVGVFTVEGLPADCSLEAKVSAPASTKTPTVLFPEKISVSDVKIYDKAGILVPSDFAIVTLVGGKLTISKRPVAITTDSATKVYDGKPLTKKTSTVGAGLLPGHTLKKDALMYTGVQIEVGSSKNTIDAKKLKVYNNGTDITYCYKFIINEGTLEVTAPPVAVLDPEGNDGDNSGNGGEGSAAGGSAGSDDTNTNTSAGASNTNTSDNVSSTGTDDTSGNNMNDTTTVGDNLGAGSELLAIAPNPDTSNPSAINTSGDATATSLDNTTPVLTQARATGVQTTQSTQAIQSTTATESTAGNIEPTTVIEPSATPGSFPALLSQGDIIEASEAPAAAAFENAVKLLPIVLTILGGLLAVGYFVFFLKRKSKSDKNVEA